LQKKEAEEEQEEEKIRYKLTTKQKIFPLNFTKMHMKSLKPQN